VHDSLPRVLAALGAITIAGTLAASSSAASPATAGASTPAPVVVTTTVEVVEPAVTSRAVEYTEDGEVDDVTTLANRSTSATDGTTVGDCCGPAAGQVDDA